ncbi:Hypothetical protein NTJ_10038 [Nesidiocoris tenuis]|uniref:AP2/ERF domain-containing protein n=1 Tax=Nesidiocoris tenuis TaxID=355587 RepID=A0ABN7AYG8_9HEMI|nr:Hypothetical protein NTJ_10038 [Nesidiocoris tenuis]
MCEKDKESRTISSKGKSGLKTWGKMRLLSSLDPPAYSIRGKIGGAPGGEQAAAEGRARLPWRHKRNYWKIRAQYPNGEMRRIFGSEGSDLPRRCLLYFALVYLNQGLVTV